jgi:hypothetical protein
MQSLRGINKILIAGGTGWLGKQIRARIGQINSQIQVVSISRTPGPNIITWDDIKSKGIPSDADAVVNVTGRNIFEKRWTDEFKKELIDSRVNPVRTMVDAITKAEAKGECNVKVMLTASGSAYPPSETKSYTEDDEYGNDFGGIICKEVEKAATFPSNSKVRSVYMRIGVVLGDEKGGGLPWLIPMYKWGLGGRLGNGKQYFPWIHVDDLMNVVVELLQNDKYKGPVNIVAPDIVTNQQMSDTLASVLRRPAFFWKPAFIVSSIFGERSYLILGGKKVVPKKLLEFNYDFQYKEIRPALEDLVKKYYS